MAEAADTTFLSIGEVLGLLLEEFPDITISKIRFLESQGLIAPERTASGYRKFYEQDIELLKVILREQRENYLPLRVIKDRLDSGQIDPSGEMPQPHFDDADDTAALARPDHDHGRDDGHGPAHDDHGLPASDSDEARSPTRHDVPAASVAGHPAARAFGGAAANGAANRAATPSEPDHTPVAPRLLPGVVLGRDELCSIAGITGSELEQLETYGIVAGRSSGGSMLYGDEAVETAKLAAEFLRAGVDARHLRGWRTAVEREASLYEQLITPRLRQRNPEARAGALEQLRTLDELGAKLRNAMMRTALRHHYES